MNNKVLGTLALIGAPFMLFGFYLETSFKQLHDSWFTGVWGIMFISSWTASVVVLKRIYATGHSRFGRIIINILLGTLIVANISNVIQLVAPDKPWYFFYLDMCWPISNLIMLIVGITIVRAGQINGWKRFVPLAVGLWFPLTMVFAMWLKIPGADLYVGGLYSAIAWIVLGLMARKVSFYQGIVCSWQFAVGEVRSKCPRMRE